MALNWKDPETELVLTPRKTRIERMAAVEMDG